MHFIGMLAIRLPINLSYDIPLTLLSLAMALAGSYAGFAVVLGNGQKPSANHQVIVLGALLMGAGVSSMHFTGMYALKMFPPIQYDLALVSLAIAIALVASYAALHAFIYLNDQKRLSSHLALNLAALVMSLAVSGMHYTAMGAAKFPLGAICQATSFNIGAPILIGLVGSGSVLLISLALLSFLTKTETPMWRVLLLIGAGEVSIMEILEHSGLNQSIGHWASVIDGLAVIGLVFPVLLRLKKTAQSLQDERKQIQSQYLSLMNLQQAVEQAPVTIVITDLEGNIQYVNPHFTVTTGYSAEEAIGVNPRILKSGHTTQKEYQELWQTITSKQAWTGLFHNKRKDGSLYWEQASISPVTDVNGEIKSYVAVKENITGRIIAEEELKKASIYARSLIEASLDPLVTISVDGKIMDVNAATEKVTGCRRDELIGSDFSDYFTDPAKARAGYQQVFSEGFVTDYPLAIRHRSGVVTEVLYNATVYRDSNGEVQGIFAAARDVTQRHAMEKSLLEQRETMQLMLESSPIAVRVAANGGRKVLFANQRYVELIDSEVDRVIGADPRTYYANAEDYDKVLYQIELGHAVVDRLIELQIPGKGTVWTIASYMPIEYLGEDAVLGWFYDVTALREAKDLAERMARLRSEFLANMSHEIRTPMNGIIGLAELALNQPASPQVRDYLEKISSSSQSLLGILNDILDFSKIEAGRMSVEQQPFDLDLVIDNLRNLFEQRAQARHLDFTILIADGTPRDLIGDAMRLQQILSNLLGNAIKFTEHGHITLNITPVEVAESQARLHFSVEDSGIGMLEQDLDNLFQPFSQVDSSITRRYGGTGLGLAISHKLLELMGGRFEVSSQIRRGTQFQFTLEFRLPTQKSVRATRQHTHHQAGELGHRLRHTGEGLKGCRILVAEDNRINQQVVREFLKLSGMEVDIAANGVEVLELLRKNQYDAILMDVHMPEMDGMEATERIRRLPQFAHLPIIALTAGVTEEERAKCMECGMSDFVTKPINAEQLINSLSLAINKHE